MTTPPRTDLVFEQLVLLDGSGDYTSGWIDSSEIYSIRVEALFLNGISGGFRVQEAMYDGSSTPRVIRDETLTVTSDYVYADLTVGARWFRFLVTSGDPNDNVAVTMRKVG